MKWTLNWFKEKKKEEEELLTPKYVETNTWESTLVSPLDIVEESVLDIRPFLQVRLVNDVLTVVMNNGNVLYKSPATEVDFNNITFAKTEDDVLLVMSIPEIILENAKMKVERDATINLQASLEILNQLDDFDVIDNTVYLKGTNRSIPELLVNRFIEIVEFCKSLQSSVVTDLEILENVLRTAEDYQALKNFFLWCCLNPRAEVADQLYGFLQKNSFRITKQGFFVALRNVVTVQVEGENKELVDFVSNTYNKVKAVWKKKPSNFNVWQNNIGDEYSIHYFDIIVSDAHPIGDLNILYKDLPNMKGNRYTDAYTGTFDIRVGKVVSMPMNDCNWSTADCAHAGLHFTSDEINYVGCGDTSVLVLINPMTVVGIGTSKGRCYEYLPIMTVPAEEATELLHDLDFDTLELDEDYAIKCLESLSEKVKGGFVAETTKYSFNLPQISTEEIQGIVASLEKMKESLSKRVSII